ncbi:MAG: polysaccharide biosynthesis C-terminal domain-containing protein [Bacteroidales bacterium]
MVKKILNTFGTRLLSAVINLLITIVISRFLGPEGKGQQGLIIATIAYVLVFANLMGGATIVYLVPRFAWSLILVPAYLWTLFTGLVFYAVLHFTGLVQPQFILHICLLSVISGFAAINSSILIGKEKIASANMVSLLQPFLIAASLALFFFVMGQATIQSYLLSLYIAFGGSFFLSLFYLKKFTGKYSLHGIGSYFGVISKLARYGVLNQLAHIFQLLSFRMSYYWLNQLYSEAEVGVYSNAISIVESVWLISRSISMVQYASIVNTDDRDYSRRLTISLSKIAFFISFVLLGILVLLPSQFFVFIYGEGFGEISTVIRSQAPGILFFSFALVGGHYFSGTGKYHVNTLASLAGLLISVVLFWLMIPALGMTGAGWATSISYTFTAIVVMIFFLSESGLSLKVFLPQKHDVEEFRTIIRTVTGKK